MPAELYREVRGQVHKGSKMSVIEDRGFLRGAVAASNGYYLFSETGAGVQPLVLIGLWNEVLNWLAMKAASGIDNRIGTLPDIYMGIAYYKPGTRFKGLFPVQQAVQQIAQNLSSFVPGNTITDIGGIIADTVGIVRDQVGERKKKDTANLSTTPVYVKFNYLQDDGSDKIGRGRMSFGDIRPIVLKALSGMSHVKEAPGSP